MRLIEPYAGLAAYSLYHAALRSGGRREPPVSRVGNKMRYAEPVTRAWGIKDVTDVHVNDLCPLMTGLHLVYASPILRREVARRIWAMVPCPLCLPERIELALKGLDKPRQKGLQGRPGCEACGGSGVRDCRALWEDTRKRTIPAQALAALKLELELDVGDAGAWLDSGIDPEERTGKASAVQSSIADRLDSLRIVDGMAGTVADGIVLQAGCYRNLQMVLNGHTWRMSREKVASSPTLGTPKDPDWLADRVEDLPETLADVIADGIFLQSRNFQLKPLEVRAVAWKPDKMKPEVDGYQRAPGSHPGGEDSPRWAVGQRLDEGRWEDKGFRPELSDSQRAPRDVIAHRVGEVGLRSPAGVRWHVTHTDATKALPPGDLSDAVVILDPPYAGTSGYAAKSGRDAVVELALDADRRGALVLIHEAEAIIPGWFVRNAAELHDYKSTHWADGQMREVITANRKPGWWPARQVGLFG